MNRYYENNGNDYGNDPSDRSRNLLISTSDDDLVRIDIESITFHPQKTQLFSGTITDETLSADVTTSVECTNLELCVKLGEEGVSIILDRYLEDIESSVDELISLLDSDEMDDIEEKDLKVKEIIFIEINQVVGFKMESRNIYFEFEKGIISEHYCYPSESISSATQIPELTNRLLENATLMIAKPKNLVSKGRLMKFKEGVNLQRLDRSSYEPTFNWNQDTTSNWNQNTTSNWNQNTTSNWNQNTTSNWNQYITSNWNQDTTSNWNQDTISNWNQDTTSNWNQDTVLNKDQPNNNFVPVNKKTSVKSPEVKINNQFANNKIINHQPKYNHITKHKYSSFTIHYAIDSPIHRTTIKNTFQIPEKATLEELLFYINKQQTTTSSFEATLKNFYYENNFNQKIMIVDEEDWKLAKWERKMSGKPEFFIKFC
ncbi:22733_t:CDS:2 [Cetraspora pellucida]|uniref:22733_t:CDS:1 n=1 Tax=Cetraspora pellucida TaxID=1433469 RepID=A0A9N9APP3_9GLOM|nr:22733_t:CDS:2 [Cetraspora pellucida]